MKLSIIGKQRRILYGHLSPYESEMKAIFHMDMMRRLSMSGSRLRERGFASSRHCDGGHGAAISQRDETGTATRHNPPPP